MQAKHGPQQTTKGVRRSAEQIFLAPLVNYAEQTKQKAVIRFIQSDVSIEPLFPHYAGAACWAGRKRE
jgi:hypothetical protein